MLRDSNTYKSLINEQIIEMDSLDKSVYSGSSRSTWGVKSGT